jgi:cytochrome c55X
MHGIILYFSIIIGLLFLGIENVYSELSDARQKELTHLLLHDCGSCHGMTLKGGLGPALQSNNLSNKSIEFLVLTISFGRTGTPMPPFKGILSDEDIQWLARYLKKETS